MQARLSGPPRARQRGGLNGRLAFLVRVRGACDTVVDSPTPGGAAAASYAAHAPVQGAERPPNGPRRRRSAPWTGSDRQQGGEWPAERGGKQRGWRGRCGATKGCLGGCAAKEQPVKSRSTSREEGDALCVWGNGRGAGGGGGVGSSRGSPGSTVAGVGLGAPGRPPFKSLYGRGGRGPCRAPQEKGAGKLKRSAPARCRGVAWRRRRARFSARPRRLARAGAGPVAAARGDGEGPERGGISRRPER